MESAGSAGLCCPKSGAVQDKGEVTGCPRHLPGRRQLHVVQALSFLHRWRAQSVCTQQERDRLVEGRFAAWKI